MLNACRLSSGVILLLALFAPPAATAQRPELVVQAGHREYPRSVSFAPDGKTFVTASRDRTVKLWETETGRLARDFVGHAGAATAVAFSAGGRVLATGAEDGALKLWDANTGRLLHTLAGHARRHPTS